MWRGAIERSGDVITHVSHIPPLLVQATAGWSQFPEAQTAAAALRRVDGARGPFVGAKGGEQQAGGSARAHGSPVWWFLLPRPAAARGRLQPPSISILLSSAVLRACLEYLGHTFLGGAALCVDKSVRLGLYKTPHFVTRIREAWAHMPPSNKPNGMSRKTLPPRKKDLLPNTSRFTCRGRHRAGAESLPRDLCANGARSRACTRGQARPAAMSGGREPRRHGLSGRAERSGPRGGSGYFLPARCPRRRVAERSPVSRAAEGPACQWQCVQRGVHVTGGVPRAS